MKLEAILHELRTQADEYAEAQGERVYLENFKHSKLAILQKEYALKGFDTNAAQEREARADPEYIELLKGLREATKIAERNIWYLKIAIQGTSLHQSQLATKRAELKALNDGSN